MDEAERQLIEVTLEHTGGNKTRAAEMLGISLKTLHNKLNRMKTDDTESAPDRMSPLSIKTKQVAGVTLLVGFAVVVLSALVPVVAGATCGSKRPTRARELVAEAPSATARSTSSRAGGDPARRTSRPMPG